MENVALPPDVIELVKVLRPIKDLRERGATKTIEFNLSMNYRVKANRTARHPF